MIQVLTRAFGVLELLATEETITLKDMAAQVGLKKPTLCVILKTLTDMGYVQKAEQGRYAIGPKLMGLSFPTRRKSVIARVAEHGVRELAEQVRESTVAGIAHKGQRYTIAHATFQQTVMVDTKAVVVGTFFESATGRTLLAHMDDADLQCVLDRHGMPGERWKEIGSIEDLRAALLQIRQERFVDMLTKDGQARFLAVPVFGPDGKLWMALGLGIPLSRYQEPHKGQVIRAMRDMGERLSHELSLAMDGNS